MDELAATSRAAYRALVHDDPGFASFFRDITPIRELSDLRLGLAAGRARSPRRGADDRFAAGDPVDVRLVAGADQPARLVRARARARGVSRRARRGRSGRDRPARARLAVPVEPPRQRRDEPGQGRHGRRPAVRGARPRRRRRPPLGRHRDRIPADRLAPRAGHRTRAAARWRRRSSSGRSRCGTRTSIRCPSSRSGCSARLRRCRPTIPERARVLRLVQLTVNGVAAGLQSTG